MRLPQRVNQSDYQVVRPIGLGAFSQVTLVLHKKTKKPFVVKIIPKYKILDNKFVDHVYSEFVIQNQVDFQWVTKIEGWDQDEQCLYLLMEFVPGGEFFQYLRRKTLISTDQVVLYSANVLLCIEHLQLQQIIYRDIKPENFLFQANGYLKVCDFGFAKVVKSRTYTLCGTPEYIAPEVILHKGHGKAVDFWSFGMLIFEMCAGFTPFEDENPMEIYQQIIKCKLEFPKFFDKCTKNLLSQLIQPDLSKRIGNLLRGINDIKQDPFYQDLDWEQVKQQKYDMDYKPQINKYFFYVSENHGNCYPKTEGYDFSKIPKITERKDPFLKWL